MTKKTINSIIESYIANEVSEEVRVAFDKWITDRESCAEKDEALNDIWENMPLTSGSVEEDPFAIIELYSFIPFNIPLLISAISSRLFSNIIYTPFHINTPPRP